jgi:hypothetical protein
MTQRSRKNPPVEATNTQRGLAIGLAIGAGLGVAMGAALDNMAFMAIGVGAGMSIGLSIGAALDQQSKEEGTPADNDLDDLEEGL